MVIIASVRQGLVIVIVVVASTFFFVVVAIAQNWIAVSNYSLFARETIMSRHDS